MGWGGALGTPSPSLPSTVPWGTVWAGEWVAGSCCSRWSAGPDHSTACDEGRVCPPAGAICKSWLCLQGPSPRLLVPGTAASM